MLSKQYRIPSFAASAMLLLLSIGAVASQQCPKGEQPLEFRFFTDNNSWKDNGWILECDYEDDSRELVWSVAIGSIKFNSHTEVIREAACVPDTATCTLNIFDAKGDGLQGSQDDPSNSFAGWFAFLHGATTIATYNTMDEPRFNELTYCVGPDCDQEPIEVQGNNVNNEDCHDIVYLAMQLDNNPLDTSYQLICGGEDDGVFDKKIIWNGNGFTQPGAYVEEETCLPKDACCEFIVVDGDANGLTETVEKTTRNKSTRPKGFVYLERNYEPVLEYDGSTGETFGVMTKSFGCAADKVDNKEKDIGIIATEVVDIPEDEDVESEMDVEVGDNLEEVFDPEKNSEHLENTFGAYIEDDDEKLKDEEEAINTLKEIFGVYTDSDSTSNPSKTFPPTTEDWISDDDYQNFNDDDSEFGLFTFPPTTANWVSDDDNQEFNDDGSGFGLFTGTETPTLMASSTESSTESSAESSTWAPTSDSSSERDDDIAWTQMDDLEFDVDAMSEIDGMIQDLTDHTPKLHTDPNAALFLNGEPVYATSKKGLKKSAKIIIGVLVPLFLLWTIGLGVCYFFGPRRNDDHEDKGTTGEASSGGSIGSGDVFEDVDVV